MGADVHDYDDWSPSASIATLRARAKALARIRDFFTDRGYLEVETPVLSAFGVTDVYLESLTVQCFGKPYYLQTSPEYHMKRLLAAGSGPIFQLARAFRADEAGRWHNPEFTMLEWYRPGIQLDAMLQEIDLFLKNILNAQPLLIKTYQSVFEAICGINPFNASISVLKQCLAQFDLTQILPEDEIDTDQYLFLLMSHVIEPALAAYDAPVAITHFPETQAALACVQNGRALRFEVYYQGIELANGFYELTDVDIQAARFKADNQKRRQQGLRTQAIDRRFLAAMAHGLPESTGVALGVDRLLSILLQLPDIQAGLAFDISRA